MRTIQLPAQDHWWMGDGSYHDAHPVEEREYRRATDIPDALFSRQPFQDVERPAPVYVSEELARYMREIVPVDQRELFEVKQTEVDHTFKTEIARAPSEGLRGNPNDPDEPESHMTDESFRGEPEELGGAAAELVEEVDAHLIYLRERLRRIQQMDPDVVKQKTRMQKTQPVKQMSSWKTAPRTAKTPTADVVGHLNTQLVSQVEERFFKPSLYELQCVQKQRLPLKTVDRQCGGSVSAMQKRAAAAPFRRQAKLLPRTPNRAVLDQTSTQDPLSIRSLHPADPRVSAARQAEVCVQDYSLQLGDEELLMTKEQLLEELEAKRAKNVVRPGFVRFASVPDDGQTTEVKLEGKQDDDVLETTARILAQLRTDEQHLSVLMKDYQAEQNREANPGWYADNSSGFAHEAHQTRLQEALQDLAKELNCPVEELMECADAEKALRAPRASKAETAEAGC